MQARREKMKVKIKKGNNINNNIDMIVLKILK